MPAINMPARAASPLEGLLGIVNTVSNLKKNSSEGDLLAQKTEAESVANKQAEVGLQNSQAQMKALQTPGSPEGEALKRGLIGSISLGKQAFPVKDPDAQSALNDTINSLKDPNVTGWQAKQMADASPLIASLKDYGDKQIAANAMAAAAQIRAQPMNERNNTAKDTQTEKAVNDVTNDHQLNAHMQRLNGINRIQSQIADMKAGKFVDTNQFLGDINNEYTNALTGSNNPALGKQEQTSYHTAAGGLASIYQKYSGDPTSINSPKVLDQISAQIDGLKSNYQSAIKSRASMLQRTYKHNPDATAAQAGAIKDMIDSTSGSSPAAGKNPPGGHMTVQQNGHTFNWNPQSGNYE